MMWFNPPIVIDAGIFSALPEQFRQPKKSSWADANKGGALVHSFLEGPSFDRAGRLYVVDLAHGRIFRIASDGAEWECVAEYAGWPNGLKIHQDGRIFVADYQRGIMLLDPVSRKISPYLTHRHSESFRGVNDLFFAWNGDLYFTDQGQTGWHDPSGRVYRQTADGVLELLLDNVPSPNGIVLSHNEQQLFVAVTRALSVWRAPIMQDGSLSKVGTHVQFSFGTSGPDGLAMDAEGGLVVAQMNLGVWRFDARARPTHFVECGETAGPTNIAFGGADNRTLYITDSNNGIVLQAEMPFAGKPMFSHL